MQPVEIYTSPFCGFCVAAKRLLKTKGVAFSEVDVSRQPERRQEMMKILGAVLLEESTEKNSVAA